LIEKFHKTNTTADQLEKIENSLLGKGAKLLIETAGAIESQGSGKNVSDEIIRILNQYQERMYTPPPAFMRIHCRHYEVLYTGGPIH